MNAVEYLKIDDQGLHIRYRGENQCLSVENIVICAGQTSLRTLYDALKTDAKPVHLIGGAEVAAELDAKRAIRQGATLAATI